jgi:hypothetical protein
MAGGIAGNASECSMTKPARWNAKRAPGAIRAGGLNNHLDIASDPAFATHSDPLREEIVVGQFFKNRRKERAANIFALIDVRDNSGNAMARVSAAKALEQVPEHEAAARGQQMMPGLQIVIVQGAGGPPLRTIGPDPIDVTPNASSEDDRH